MTIFIRKSRDPFGWLGNMSPFSVTFEGQTFKTAEHLFQWLRFDGKPQIQALIKGEQNPFQAKLIAKKWIKEASVEPRSELDLMNMRLVLKLKLQSNPKLVEELLATKEEEIVEDCSNRGLSESNLFWGKCFVNSEWKGQGWLGRLWQEQRSALKIK